jgi:hypothetical protein
MNPQPKVYLPNPGCHDFTAAHKYGELIHLTTGRLKLTGTGNIYRQMYNILKDSSPDDHLLICGPTIANVIATSILISLHGRVNTLIFCSDSKTGQGRYFLRTINVNSNEENPNG